MNSVVAWNPFREFDALFGARAPRQLAQGKVAWTPAVDIFETDEAFRLELEIPAVSAESVNVALDDGVLTVSGERPLPDHEGQVRYRRERAYGPFTRSFRLPESVDEESIDAVAKDGVLTLTIGKRAQATPKRIEVQTH